MSLELFNSVRQNLLRDRTWALRIPVRPPLALRPASRPEPESRTPAAARGLWLLFGRVCRVRGCFLKGWGSFLKAESTPFSCTCPLLGQVSRCKGGPGSHWLCWPTCSSAWVELGPPAGSWETHLLLCLLPTPPGWGKSLAVRGASDYRELLLS